MSKSSQWALEQQERYEMDDDGFDANLERLRFEAIEHVNDVFFEVVERDGFDYPCNDEVINAIWTASTEILPHLEVQAVIDSDHKLFVSTGTPGYVDFSGIHPAMLKGMKLPILCWIHTHPFGSAYFSGTDWRTINTWKPLMKTAYVLGGEGATHFGYWQQNKPNELLIVKDGNHMIQYYTEEEE